MTDAEYEAAKERIVQYAAYWIPILGLSDWEISWTLTKRGLGIESTAGAAYTVSGTCHAAPEYLTAGITFDVGMLFDCDDDELEAIVLHELVHCRTEEARQVKESDEQYHIEHLTTQIERALLRARDMGRRDSDVDADIDSDGTVEAGEDGGVVDRTNGDATTNIRDTSRDAEHCSTSKTEVKSVAY